MVRLTRYGSMLPRMSHFFAIAMGINCGYSIHLGNSYIKTLKEFKTVEEIEAELAVGESDADF